MTRALDKLLRPLRRRIALMITRGVVRLINDAAKMQTMQVTALADEIVDGAERFQQYGFTGHPHAGSEALILNVGGVRSHAVVIAVDDRRYRLHLAAGEVAIYDDQGQQVKLMRSGIVIESHKGTTHNGDLAINGDLTVTGTFMLAGINMNTHKHGGVQTGGSISGGPQ